MDGRQQWPEEIGTGQHLPGGAGLAAADGGAVFLLVALVCLTFHLSHRGTHSSPSNAGCPVPSSPVCSVMQIYVSSPQILRKTKLFFSHNSHNFLSCNLSDENGSNVLTSSNDSPVRSALDAAVGYSCPC